MGIGAVVSNVGALSSSPEPPRSVRRQTIISARLLMDVATASLRSAPGAPSGSSARQVTLRQAPLMDDTTAPLRSAPGAPGDAASGATEYIRQTTTPCRRERVTMTLCPGRYGGSIRGADPAFPISEHAPPPLSCTDHELSVYQRSRILPIRFRPVIDVAGPEPTPVITLQTDIMTLQPVVGTCHCA